MKKILDKMFENKKLASWVPIVFAAVVYLLFVLFGLSEDNRALLIATPIVTLFWLFGAFLVVLLQVKNPRCPELFLNLVELLVTVAFTAFSLVGALSFIISGFQNFSPLICAGAVTYSSVCLAHHKRTK